MHVTLFVLGIYKPHKSGSVIVDCKCFFNPEKNITRDIVEKTFKEETQNATSQWLGNRFQLKAVLVRTPEPDIEPVTHSTVPNSKKSFTLKFTITNLAYTASLRNPKTELYRRTKSSIQSKLNHLFQNSTLGPHFLCCSVEDFRPTTKVNDTGVDSDCKFALDYGSRDVIKGLVYNIFKNLTSQGSCLGEYTMDKDSLNVSGYPPEVTPAKELSFWVIILICLSVLLGFILFFLLCSLIAFCLKRKAGKYQIHQNIWGIYYPHLETQKVN
ncbi:mucin-16-like [Paroedura picta]|uniref:mucin-16-like n=1 Tax=Paroedura picta TaxID=143630 RepID=UPI0040568F0D